jgi:methionyl aminopeptidase
VHTQPIIPNYDNKTPGTLKPGMTFAIEPFATDGKGMIYEAGKPMIFSFLGMRPVRSELAQGLLEKIQAFKGLPFSMHDLATKNTSLSELKIGLTELLQARVIAGYAPLIEENHGLVAQAENSVLIDEKGNVFITTRID